VVRPEFEWAGPADVSYYLIQLFDSNSDIIWEEKTIRTMLELPQDIQLHPSEKYFWQVEAFFEGGGSVISDFANFSVTTTF